MIKVAINGFGRIGRLLYRIMDEDEDINVVAINDLTSAEELAYLLKYDTAFRRFKDTEITFDENHIFVGDKSIPVYSEKDPVNLPWKELDVDVVCECTGHFTSKEKAHSHIVAGAKKVLISAPADGDLKTIVYNVNDDILDGTEEIVSAASCTTNCLAPIAKILNDNFGIVEGFMTTVHAVTSSQAMQDVANGKMMKRRGRSGAFNLIPTSTGAAKAIGLVLPELKGRLAGIAMRAPVITGSVVDLVVTLNRPTNIDEINNVFKNNVNATLNFTMDPIVSGDVIGTSCGSLVDGLSTDIIENDGKQMVKVLAWYDNEYGYSNQMVRTLKAMCK